MMEELIPLSLLMEGGRKDEWRKAVALASRFGLTLSPAETAMLRAARQEALRDAGRVEFGESALSHLVRAFCGSPWVERETWAETLAALQELFYLLRGEVRGSDAELAAAMASVFNKSGGELTALEDAAAVAAAMRGGERHG